MTVISLLKTLFHPTAKPDATSIHLPVGARSVLRPERAESAARPAPSRDQHARETELAGLIERQRQTSTSLMAGSFELVGLDDIKDALGERWSGLASRACELAEEGIRRRISETDVLQVLSDTEFSICFARLDRAAAEERAKKISREIKQELFAELPEFSSSLTVKRYVAEIELDELEKGTGSLADRLLLTMRRMRMEADRAILNYRRLLLKDFQVLFAPIWEPARELVDVNRCVLDLTLGCTTLSQFQAIADPDQMVETLADLDCLALTRSLEALHRCGRAGGGATILVPVGYQTVARHVSRREYLKLLESIPEVYRPFVRLEITTLPATIDPDQLNTTLLVVSSVWPSLVLQVNGNAEILEGLDPQPLWALSWSVTASTLHDVNLRSKSDGFWKFAKAHGLRTMAHGANTIGLALAAVEAGFDFVGGTAIHLSQDTPRPPSRLYPLTFPKRQTG